MDQLNIQRRYLISTPDLRRVESASSSGVRGQRDLCPVDVEGLRFTGASFACASGDLQACHWAMEASTIGFSSADLRWPSAVTVVGLCRSHWQVARHSSVLGAVKSSIARWRAFVYSGLVDSALLCSNRRRPVRR